MTSAPAIDLFSRFDGETYDHERDHARLAAQQMAVFNAMKDGAWRTLARIHNMTGAPQQSISARLRDCRKARNGSHTVERRFIGDGIWEYRLIVRAP